MTDQAHFQIDSFFNLIRSELLKSCSINSFDSISDNYRKLALRMTYFLNYCTFFEPVQQSFYLTLKQCIKQIQILTFSTEFQKYGHIFPLFQFVVKKYCKLMDYQSTQPNSQELVERTIKNEQSQRYCQLKARPFSNKQFAFIKSEKFLTFLTGLNNNEIVYYNSQCICCSKVFIKNVQIFNKNPFFGNILQINHKQGFYVEELQKHFCALFNSGGGVVIIGADKNQHIFIARGIRFNSQQQILQKQSIIYEALKSIQPEPYVFLERIPVFGSISESNTGDKTMLLCFRIILFQNLTYHISYFQRNIKNEKYHVTYRLCKKENKKPCELTNEQDSYYKFIHEKYRKNNLKPNSHKNIYCFRPDPFQFFPHTAQNSSQQQSLSQLKDNIEVLNESLEEESQDNHWISKFRYQDDIPKFKYEKSSLLVVPTSNHHRYIQTFSVNLDKRNIVHDLCRPFKTSFKDEPNMRQIWMISHKVHVSQMQKILKQLEIKKLVKKEIIRLMPVQKTLQLQGKKFDQYKAAQFDMKFKKKYNSSYKTELQVFNKNSHKYATYLTFDDYSQAIYGYMALQSLQLRPYFVEQGLAYIHKTH